jgi:hypothetical protein
MQTHFSSCAGVTGIKLNKRISQVAVFGKADLNGVLRKLKKVHKKAISVVKQKLWQASLDLIEAVQLGNAAKASEVLAQLGVDVNCCENTWHCLTPLLQAFQSKHMSVVRVLLADQSQCECS